MTPYSVYLEIASDGTCMAHVPDLPGCFVRAPTRSAALQLLPGAIREYHDWLRRHDEDARTIADAIELQTAGESIGSGPFDPGDPSALFPPDRVAVSEDDLERACRLLGHTRADVLALVCDLPDHILDWQPDAKEFSIRRILRHLGNAEEWYISRILPPEALPPEWQDDERMPIFDFLAMERRTALACLRALTLEQRADIVQPRHWTQYPDESWTARKTLRRMLEHEREHTAHVREVLSAYRRQLMASLAGERAKLLAALLRLDERALTERTIDNRWTIKDVLSHIAAWDRWEFEIMQQAVRGETPDFAALAQVDVFNAAVVHAWRERSLSDVLAELQDARSTWVEWLTAVPDEEFFRRRTAQGETWTFRDAVKVQWKHDREHAEQIAAQVKGGVGPKEVLLAALAAARADLHTSIALVPHAARDALPVCGDWTLKDVVGHLADWEWFCVDALCKMENGGASEIEYAGDEEAWNREHIAARRDQAWEKVWGDFNAARHALAGILEGIEPSKLVERVQTRYSPEDSAYEWVCVCISHDCEHAEGIRRKRTPLP